MLLEGHTSVFGRNSFSKTIKFLSFFRKSAYTSTALLSLLVLAILCPLYLVPDSSEATAGTATESTLTFAFVDNKNTASVSLDVSNTAGTFASSSSNQLAEFTLSTNNATGYTLKLKVDSNDGYTVLKDTQDSTNTIASISSTKTSSTFTSNTWGLLPSKYRSSNTTITNDSLNPTFFPADTTGFTMDETSNANNVANTYTVGLGIKADFTIPAGTYTNSTIIAEYVANPVNYSITYDKGNIASDPSNMPGTNGDIVSNPQTGLVSTTGITLSSKVPELTGYTFAGWCFGTVTTPANETDTCSGTVYNPNGTGTNLTFGIDQTISNNTATLHAMWAKATVAVTVNFAGSGVTGVTFTNSTYGNQSVSTSGGTANLKYGVQYTIAGTYSTNYEFDSWSATAGTLGSTSSASTTYSSTTASTLTLTGKERYVISYNANGGSGSIANQTISQGNSVILADNAFTKSNSYFKGWGTTPNGNIVYRTNESITPTSSMSLYALWGTSTNANLYDVVASLTRGTQTAIELQSNPTKTTSGIYTYNATIFGTSSDSANTKPIYYYRGILDRNTYPTVGSGGDSMDYPNHIKMTTGDNTTCWRIVRTTGSGGIKLIYNGIYGDTTANSCANTGTKTQITTSGRGTQKQFQSSSNPYIVYSIIAVGYTYNNSLIQTTSDTAVGTLFGTDSNYTTNNTRSTIKAFLEDDWYANYMTSWTNYLEASAGYCNDRSVYDDNSYASALNDTSIIIRPYQYSGSNLKMYRFGAWVRNHATSKSPSLTCPYATRDLYRYVNGSVGTGNELKYPVALLTSDEASFAGVGSMVDGSSSGYDKKSFIYSGAEWWLLSPGYRNSNAAALMSFIDDSNYSAICSVNCMTGGERPVISLIPGTTISSGSGTATDPWVITTPPSGCFVAGTQVTVSLDGKTKSIEDIQVGDTVVSYDTNTNTYGLTEVIEKISHEGADRSTKLAKLTLEDNTTLTMTLNHPIYTENGFKAVENDIYPILTENDIIHTANGNYSIKSLNIYEVEPTNTYNLNVKGYNEDTDDDTNDTYIANGIIVHNATTGSAVK